MVINQRPDDGYINATELCKAGGKDVYDYLRLGHTKEYLNELSAETGIPVSGLVKVRKGGNEKKLQGTWVHPDVAVHLAQWVSAKFAVQVSRWVREWMTTGVSPVVEPQRRTMLFMRRCAKNQHKIPTTHFSALNQINQRLFSLMEIQGYVLPDNLMPDIYHWVRFSRIGYGKRAMTPTIFPRIYMSSMTESALTCPPDCTQTSYCPISTGPLMIGPRAGKRRSIFQKGIQEH